MVRRSISRIITALAEADPDRVVAVDDTRALTARQLDLDSNRLARAYTARGVTRDSMVTLALPNTVETVVACAAVWKCGATPQPIRLGLADEERAALQDLVRPALVLGIPSADPGTPSLPAAWTPDPALSDARLPDAWARSWKAPTSSGSTGPPKVVVATAPALLDADVPVASFLPRDQVQLVSGPLTHSAAFTYAFRGLMTGHRLVLLPRFDERRVLEAVAEHRVTWALLVPTMLHRLLRLPAEVRDAADLTSLETVLHLGAPCAPDLKRRFMEWVGPERVTEVYAGSESNGVLSIRGDEWLAHPGSVGRPSGGTTVAIRDPDGTDLPTGSVGRIWLHREGDAAYRYVGGDSARTADGWDTIGDLGHLDGDGYLHIAERADDVILRAGTNVHPTEIERVLEAHPAVRGAVAFGVPDVDLGQRIEAVVDATGSDVTEERLLAWIASRLDASRRPAAVHVVASPVRDDAGKTSRRAYARRYADPGDQRG
ncbi:acid--CoA ligase [Clavibacter michiganensis]|uniref:AMP-binding protein n=1 Tax=Clavibacter michiganensis TaxID=28447 RepID=UPI000CE8B036|nr:AMP-binding protein [Clavibacter michiganensis]PPF52808.1 acid--CoA ligase [Clavibacter michiganensis]